MNHANCPHFRDVFEESSQQASPCKESLDSGLSVTAGDKMPGPGGSKNENQGEANGDFDSEESPYGIKSEVDVSLVSRNEECSRETEEDRTIESIVMDGASTTEGSQNSEGETAPFEDIHSLSGLRDVQASEQSSSNNHPTFLGSDGENNTICEVPDIIVEEDSPPVEVKDKVPENGAKLSKDDEAVVVEEDINSLGSESMPDEVIVTANSASMMSFGQRKRMIVHCITGTALASPFGC